MAARVSVAEARSRRDADFAAGADARRKQIARELRSIARQVECGDSDETVLAAAGRLIQHNQASRERCAAFYSIHEAAAGTGSSVSYRVDAHVESETVPAGSFPAFDEALDYCRDVFARRGARFGIDRVCDGHWVTASLQITGGTTT